MGSGVIGALTAVTVMLLPESLFVLGGEAIPKWAAGGVVVAAYAGGRRDRRAIAFAVMLVITIVVVRSRGLAS